MVQMCVRQDDRIDLSCRHRHVLPVALAPLLLTLEEPAIDEYLKTVLSTAIRSDVDQVFGTSDGARSPQKLDIGQSLPPTTIEPTTETGVTEEIESLGDWIIG